MLSSSKDITSEYHCIYHTRVCLLLVGSNYYYYYYYYDSLSAVHVVLFIFSHYLFIRSRYHLDKERGRQWSYSCSRLQDHLQKYFQEHLSHCSECYR